MVKRSSPCKVREESISHILIQCDGIRQLCNMLLAIFKLQQVFSYLVQYLLLEWKVQDLDK